MKFASNYVSVNIPPVLSCSQFNPNEIQECRNIAKAKIHVERAISRVKLYRILNFIPKLLYQYLSKVFQLCVALTNYGKPLITEVKDHFKPATSNENEDIESLVISESEYVSD